MNHSHDEGVAVSSGDGIDGRQHTGSAPEGIDDLFRRAVARSPDVLALVDPPDREAFTDAAPWRLTYAQADRVIDVLAGRLLDLGLPAGSTVAFQVPNTVESVIVLLGVLRAGLMPAPLPLLWRQADAVAALARLGPRALIAIRRVGAVAHGEIAMHVAAELLSVRFVCGFGRELPDGIIPLDDVFDRAAKRPSPFGAKSGPIPNGHVVTFDVTARGIVSVMHTQTELAAAGNAIVAVGGLRTGGAMLGALATSSFAGLGSVIMPWLIAGGKLVLHQPFSSEAFAAQLKDEHCETAVIPAAILQPMQDAGLLAETSALRHVLAVWRSPEFLSTATPWPNSATACIDVAAFGEAGLVPQHRGAEGMPAAIPLGPLGSMVSIEVARTSTGTLAIRGPMVPMSPYGLASGEPPLLKVDGKGFVDTEYPCRVGRDGRTLTISGPPAGLINVGGYRFAWRELQDLLAELGQGGSVAALPDRLTGHRLAGVAADRESVRTALAARGVNPLLIAAFRDRR
jgi:non-ribosomal peptide synthetase component E (peptide arylation enzyme)